MKKFLITLCLVALASLSFAANINIVRTDPQYFTMAIPIYTATHLYQGDSICTDATGYAIGCTDSASIKFWGFASEEVNNTGASGAKTIAVECGVYEVTFDSVAITNIGDTAYVKTIQSFAVSGVANNVIAGRVTKYISSTKAWIDTRVAVNSVAAIGAANVSLADAGSAITATNVEAWGQEIMLGSRGYMPIYNSAGKWAEVDCNNDGYIIAGDGTDAASVEVTAFLKTDFDVARGYALRGSATGLMEVVDANNDGEIMAGDGTDWAPVEITTFLTTDADLARGYIWRGSATGLMEAYDANGDGQFLIGDGTDIDSHAFTGVVAVNNAGLSSIVDGTLLDADVDHTVTNRTQEVEYCFWYDFATHGGGAAPIAMTKCDGAVAQTIPDNFVVKSIYYEMHTAFLSGGANVIIGFTGTTNAIATSAAHDNAKYALDAVFAAASGVPYKVSTADEVLIEPSGALTAGRVYVYVSGHQSN